MKAEKWKQQQQQQKQNNNPNFLNAMVHKCRWRFGRIIKIELMLKKIRTMVQEYFILHKFLFQFRFSLRSMSIEQKNNQGPFCFPLALLRLALTINSSCRSSFLLTKKTWQSKIGSSASKQKCWVCLSIVLH